MRANLLLLLTAIVFFSTFSSCIKALKEEEEAAAALCAKIDTSKISVPKTRFYAGEEIRLSFAEGPNIFYAWYHSKFSGQLSTSSTYTISNCSKQHEGWFYVNVSGDCSTKSDSVYIAVENNPVAAPCSPANNQVNFSTTPDITFSSVSFDRHPSYNLKELNGYQSSSYPDLSIYFHHYWNDVEPEDGEYSLHNSPSFSSVSPYHVYMTSNYQGILFVANTGKVYVSHVNGKLQVTFCNINMSGSLGGPSYPTTATGKITAP